jgi:hypothetical protein
MQLRCVSRKQENRLIGFKQTFIYVLFLTPEESDVYRNDHLLRNRPQRGRISISRIFVFYILKLSNKCKI